MNIRDRMVRLQTVQWIKEPLRKLLRTLGYELVSSRPSLHDVTQYLLRDLEIDLVADVGANQGQYGRTMRHLGYLGQILSFEPSGSAFRLLLGNSRGDIAWDSRRVALGQEEGRLVLNVAANSVSSSLLRPLLAHLSADTSSEIVATERVDVTTLDAALSGRTESRIWLKLDVQGYELRVLSGAMNTLPRVRAIQMEVSLCQLYEDEADYLDLLHWLRANRFQPVWIEPGLCDQTGCQLLQMDVIAVRA